MTLLNERLVRISQHLCSALGAAWYAPLIMLLAACVTHPASIPKPENVATNVNNLYKSFGVTIPTNGHPAITAPAIFAQVGYNMVDVDCSAYFDAVTKAENGLKMSAADVAAAGAAAATISTLAKATTKQVGIIAAAFGFGGVIINNFEQYAFATPYPTQTRTLVMKALLAYRQSTPAAGATSPPDAMQRIAGYADLCTYSGIATLAEQAITTATPEDLSKSQPLFTDAQRAEYLQPVNKLLGPGISPTDNDYVVMAAIADPKLTDAKKLTSLSTTFSSGVSPVVATQIYGSTDHNPAHDAKQPTLEAIGSLLTSLMNVNSQFAAAVQGKESGTQVAKAPTLIGIRTQ